MLSPILTHTPIWVFALLAALITLGLVQMRAREVGLRRASALPLVMVALSLAGAASAFGLSPAPLAAWAAALAVAALAVLRLPPPEGLTYNPATRRFRLPGSAAPLGLMMGIFFTKYAVGAALGMQLELTQKPAFAVTACAMYGLFSGVFLARGIRLWRMAGSTRPAAAVA